jgi:hypothetical protein
MQLDKAIKERYSCRRFSDKKPDWRTIIEAIDSVRYAPMAGNNFSLKFILVNEPEKIKKITEASQQTWMRNVHYVVVVCTEPARTINLFEERGKTYFRQQAGAAIQNFLLKLEELGLNTCWIGHFYEDMIKEVLKIPKNIEVEAIFPIGFEFKKPASKKRKIDLDSVLYFNSWKEKRMVPLEKLDV